MSLTPQYGGNIHGSISFIEKSGGNDKQFTWYAMELICSSPEPVTLLKYTHIYVKFVCVQINSSNPINKNVEFIVSIIGEGLFGENKLILSPNL